MHIRLNDKDIKYVRLIQRHFNELQPIPIPMSGADIVRLGLRQIVDRLAEMDENVRKDKTSIEIDHSIPKGSTRGGLADARAI